MSNPEGLPMNQIEDIYGMSLPELKDLIQTRGYLPEPIEADDPNFEEKYEEFLAHQRKFGQVEVKLFDRVLSGEASEAEMEIAEEHARHTAEGTRLMGFSFAPKNWYTNERLTNAMAETSSENKEWIDYVKKNYSNEQLKKGFQKIDEDGFVRTYERK